MEKEALSLPAYKIGPEPHLMTDRREVKSGRQKNYEGAILPDRPLVDCSASWLLSLWPDARGSLIRTRDCGKTTEHEALNALSFERLRCVDVAG